MRSAAVATDAPAVAVRRLPRPKRREPVAPATYVPAAAQGEAPPPDTVDPTAEVVADARKKLEEIDKLMKDAEQ